MLGLALSLGAGPQGGSSAALPPLPAPLPVTALLMGQSELQYLINPLSDYQVIAQPVPGDGNLTVVTQYGEGTAPVWTEVNPASVAAGQVNPAMAALSAFLAFAAPDRRFVLGDGVVAGTGRADLANDDLTDGRLWTDFTAVVDAMEITTGKPVEHLIECWYNADSGGITSFRFNFWPFYFGMTSLGAVDPLTGTFRHCLWDGAAPASEKGRGVFAREATRWHVLTPMPFFTTSTTEFENFSANAYAPMEPARQVLHNLETDPLAQSVAVRVGPSAHLSRFDGDIHPKTDNPDGQIQMMWPVAMALLRAAGQSVEEPQVVGVEGPADGTYADLLVSLPNGGTLTTLRRLREGPVFDGLSPHRQEVTGLELTRSGTRRPVFQLGQTTYPAEYRGTVTVQAEAETHATYGRVGRVRIAPETPFAFGNSLSYLRGQATAVLKRYRDDLLYEDFLIEHVPALYDAAATYPFEGIAVRPFQDELPMLHISAAPFVAQSAVLSGSNNYHSSVLTVPASNKGVLSCWLRATGAWAKSKTLLELRVTGNTPALLLRSTTTTRLTLYNHMTDRASTGINFDGMVADQWYHLLFAWDFDLARWQTYLNDVAGAQPSGFGTGYLLNDLDPVQRMGIGANASNVEQWVGEIGHLYLNLTESLDLSDPANRARFASAGSPVDLGITGQLPTGSTPQYYFDGLAPDWINLGTGQTPAKIGTWVPGSSPGY